MRPFPLHPEIPAEGQRLDELFADRPQYLDSMRQRLFEAFRAEGLPYGNLDRTFNTRLAQELALWGDTQPAGAALHDKLFEAVFVDGTNIGDPRVLLALAEGVGLNTTEASVVLEKRTMAGALLQEWTHARAGGLRGVPAYIINGHGVVGAQPLQTLEHLMDKVGARRRAPAA